MDEEAEEIDYWNIRPSIRLVKKISCASVDDAAGNEKNPKKSKRTKSKSWELLNLPAQLDLPFYLKLFLYSNCFKESSDLIE